MKPKYIRETASGNLSLKVAGFFELQRKNEDEIFEDVESLLSAAIEDLSRNAEYQNSLAYGLENATPTFKEWLLEKFPWISEEHFQSIAEANLEEAEALKNFLALYKKGDERAKLPASMSRFDTRPPKPKRPVGRPRKYDSLEAMAYKFENIPDELPGKPPMPKWDEPKREPVLSDLPHPDDGLFD